MENWRQLINCLEINGEKYSLGVYHEIYTPRQLPCIFLRPRLVIIYIFLRSNKSGCWVVLTQDAQEILSSDPGVREMQRKLQSWNRDWHGGCFWRSFATLLPIHVRYRIQKPLFDRLLKMAYQFHQIRLAAFNFLLIDTATAKRSDPKMHGKLVNEWVIPFHRILVLGLDCCCKLNNGRRFTYFEKRWTMSEGNAFRWNWEAGTWTPLIQLRS